MKELAIAHIMFSMHWGRNNELEHYGDSVVPDV